MLVLVYLHDHEVVDAVDMQEKFALVLTLHIAESRIHVKSYVRLGWQRKQRKTTISEGSVQLLV